MADAIGGCAPAMGRPALSAHAAHDPAGTLHRFAPGVLLSLQWSQVDLDTGVLTRLKAGARKGQEETRPKVKLGSRFTRTCDAGSARRGPEDRLPLQGSLASRGPAGRGPPWGMEEDHRGVRLVWRHAPHAAPHPRDMDGAGWRASVGGRWLPRMTTKTLEGIYAHHCPDFQGRAANI